MPYVHCTLKKRYCKKRTEKKVLSILRLGQMSIKYIDFAYRGDVYLHL